MSGRTRNRLIAAVVAVAVIATVVVGAVAVAAATSSRSPCMRSSDYGKQCETIAGNGLTVTGIEARYVGNVDLTGKTWTFETTVYRCDPRGRPKAACAPEQRVYGSLHRGNPRDPSIPACTSEGTGISKKGCSGRLNFPLPRTFAGTRWVCSEVAVRVGLKWIDNGAGLVSGARACNRVH